MRSSRFSPVARSGVTLVELLLFVGILALSTGAIIGFFLLTTDARVRHAVASDVEQSAIQVQGLLENEIRHAERIIDPAQGSSGAVLTLQVADDDTGPVIISVESGYLLIVRHDAEYLLTPPDVTVSGWRVYNVSASSARQTATVEFTVSKRIPLIKGGTYSRLVRQTFTVFPDDARSGNACSCPSPQCDHGIYEWGVCEGSCVRLSGAVLCI